MLVGAMTTRVLATGTFDLMHVGHLHYLAQAKTLGDELVVCVARDRNVLRIKQRQPILPENVRLEMVSALRIVDRAVLGSEVDLFETVRREQPDVIALGPTQTWDEDRLRRELATRDIKAAIVRVKGTRIAFPSSTSAIVERVVAARRMDGCIEATVQTGSAVVP